MKISKYILVSLVLLSSLAFGQGEMEKGAINKQKNIVHFSSGTTQPNYLTFYGAYERVMRERKERFIKSMWISIGSGYFREGILGENNGYHVNARIFALTGISSSHVEISIGPTFLNMTSDYSILKVTPTWYLFPAGNIGYRFQEQDNHFVFRVGVGIPDAIYVGIGYKF